MATVDINGLVFNASPWRRVTALDGWWGTPGLDAKVTATGGDGGVATAPWVLKERYVTVSGHDVGTDPVQFRRDLLAVLPANTDVPVTLTYDDGSTEQMFVRLYDALDFTIRGNQCRFTLPLVALDPHKYGASPLTADMGVFTGEAWFQDLLVDTAPTPDVWYETFTVDTAPTPDVWYETFEQEVPTGDELPLAATLESSGDSRSERVTVEVTGPLTQGDWWVMNESTGEVLYADLGVAAGQALVFDCYTKTATLDGSSVDHLVYGDWLTLAPGINTFRLLAGTDSDGYASVTAREAYR